jgi:hypothetical protein
MTVLRGHEVKTGYELARDGPNFKFPGCITVFSAPNYVDGFKNAGAVATIRNGLLTLAPYLWRQHPMLDGRFAKDDDAEAFHVWLSWNAPDALRDMGDRELREAFKLTYPGQLPQKPQKTVRVSEDGKGKREDQARKKDSRIKAAAAAAALHASSSSSSSASSSSSSASSSAAREHRRQHHHGRPAGEQSSAERRRSSARAQRLWGVLRRNISLVPEVSTLRTQKDKERDAKPLVGFFSKGVNYEGRARAGELEFEMDWSDGDGSELTMTSGSSSSSSSSSRSRSSSHASGERSARGDRNKRHGQHHKNHSRGDDRRRHNRRRRR